MFRSSNKKQQQKQQQSLVKLIDSPKELSPRKSKQKNLKKSNMQSQEQMQLKVATNHTNNQENNPTTTDNNFNEIDNAKTNSKIDGKHEKIKVTNEKSPQVKVASDQNIPRLVNNLPSDRHQNSTTGGGAAAAVVALGFSHNNNSNMFDNDYDDCNINNNKNNHNSDNIINDSSTSKGQVKKLSVSVSSAKLDNEQITQHHELQIDQVTNDDDSKRNSKLERTATSSVERSETIFIRNKNDADFDDDNLSTSHEKSTGQIEKENSKKLANNSFKLVSSPSSTQQSSAPAIQEGINLESEVIYDNCDIKQEKCNTPANLIDSRNTTITIGRNSGTSHETNDPDSKKNMNSNNDDPDHDKIECSIKQSKQAKKFSKDEAKRIEKEAKKLRKQLAKENKKLSKTQKNANKVKDDKTNNHHIKDKSNNKESKEVKPLTQSQQPMQSIQAESSSSSSSTSVSNRQVENEQKQKQKPTADKTIKELKIFQDHKLINQSDPMEDLKKKLNALNNGDNKFQKQQQQPSSRLLFNKTQSHPPKGNNSFIKNNSHDQQPRLDSSHPPIYGNQPQLDGNQTDFADSQEQDFYYNVTSNQLASQITINYDRNDKELINNQQVNKNNPSDNIDSDGCNDDYDFTTIKKGVLWVHQNYDRLSSKIFTRWKKRYFILTADYFVCFKRSQSKVGHSEMGCFIYKVS